MSGTIEVTPAQAGALVDLTGRTGVLAIRQLAVGEGAHEGDLYATPHGSSTGYRIAVDGTVHEMGKTLPGPE